MKNDTQKEIGELLEEITSEDWDLAIDVDDSDGRAVWVTIQPRQTSDDRGQSDFGGSSVVEALRKTVDEIRRICGKPSLEEELAKMLEEDALHADAQPVTLGPLACCHCGSRRPLEVTRSIVLHLDWADGWPVDGPRVESINPGQPGEIGTCPDCGRHYTFQA